MHPSPIPARRDDIPNSNASRACSASSNSLAKNCGVITPEIRVSMVFVRALEVSRSTVFGKAVQVQPAITVPIGAVQLWVLQQNISVELIGHFRGFSSVKIVNQLPNTTDKTV